MLSKLSAVPRPVLFYLASSFFMGLSNTIFDVVFNFYLAERGIDEASAGVIYAVATGVMAVAVVPLLLLGRVVSQRAILVGASVLFACPFAAMPFVTSVPAASAFLSVNLAGMLGQLSVGNSIAGAHVSPAARTRLFSGFFICYLGAGAVGSTLVSLLGGLLDTSDLRKYQFFLLLSFLSGCLLVAARVASARQAPRAAAAGTDAASRPPGERRNFVVLFVAAGCLGASIALVFRFANVLFAQIYDLPVGEVSLILGGDKIISVIGAVSAPLLVRRFSLRPSAAFFGVLACVSLLVQSLTVPLAVFTVFYMVRLLANYCLMPLLDTVAMSGFAPARRLVSISLRQSSFYLGGAVAAAVYGNLLNQGDWRAALWVSGGCALAGALAVTLVRDAEAAPPPPDAGAGAEKSGDKVVLEHA
ncbi:MFS transporter [Streptomyces sp. NPDC006134]|uniref:MFS transporter n=1 Tax=Streptomyces sp. NPDC006134 TaxID=3154467 RepID=UPI0033E59444